MAKTYTTKRYELKTIGIVLQSLDPDQISNIKATELAKLSIVNFTLRGIAVTILTAPTFRNGLLSIEVSAKKGAIPLKVDNPLLFKNPPIMVWDGTWYQEFNNEFKVLQDFRNFVEDPLGALQEIIVQAIEVQNK